MAIEEYQKEIEEVLKDKKTSKEGLTEKEVNKRLEKYGKNKLEEKKKKSQFYKFLSQFKDLMVIILIVTAIISFVIALIEKESLVEGFIILGIVVINALLGYLQEAKADKAVEELRKMSVPDVKVRRNNRIIITNIESIVPGDILVLEAGDYVPADARIMWSASLKVEEASLTGESGSVSKDKEIIKDTVIISERTNMIFSGSSIVYGKCEAITTATGMNTELGKIAESLSTEVSGETPLQKKINNISKILTIIVGIIVFIMLIIGVSSGDPILDVFIISISLAVAAIPEGLPAVITVILSLGMTKLAKKSAVVRKISSVETLGSTEIICSDKTGTITKNKMTVRKFYFNNEITKEVEDNKMHEIMFLCNDVTKDKDNYIGDPTEIALYQYVEKNKEIKNERIYEFPFDSDRKLMTTINNFEKTNNVLTKGSLDNILNISTKYYLNGKIIKLTEKHKNEIKENEKLLSDEALRVLGLAFKDIEKKNEYKIEECEKDLIFVGLVGMIDPPRDTVAESIKRCYIAGIKPVMITGDNINTAIAIAKEVGIYKENDLVIEGKELDLITDEELEKTVNQYSVYARVTPKHKLRIVKAWQKNNKIVAMTGDGVNDAPAIKVADVGVGMGITGTEVSKSVSDIVLMDDSFDTIVLAVEEGRNIYENIRKAISYLLTANIAEVLIVFIAMIFGYNIFLPIHLLYINLVTDSLPAIALSFEKNDKNIMKKKARNNTGTIFTPFLTGKIAFSSILKALVVLIIYFTSMNFFGAEKATTMAFLSLILLEMAYALSCKNLFESLSFKNLFSNKYMNISILFLIGLQILIYFTPAKNLFEIINITIYEFAYILVFVFITFILDEIVKPIFSKKLKD